MVCIRTNDDVLTAGSSSSNEVFKVGVVHIPVNKKKKIKKLKNDFYTDEK